MADATHDGFAAALSLFVEAYSRIPPAAEVDAAPLLALQPSVVPRAAEIQGSYATQASRAIERQEAASETQRAVLRSFPLEGERTLEDLFDGYVAAGREIDSLLRQRADAANTDVLDRGQAGQLRVAAIGLLGQLRDALAVEEGEQPELARTVDRHVFAYVDLLQASRLKGGPGASAPPPPVEELS